MVPMRVSGGTKRLAHEPRFHGPEPVHAARWKRAAAVKWLHS